METPLKPGECEYCHKAVAGSGTSHPSCKKKALATKSKTNLTPRGNTRGSSKLRKMLVIDASPEQKLIREQQAAHDKLVDSKHRVDLGTRIYKPGTPEFQAIADDLIKREKSQSISAPRRSMMDIREREKNSTSGIRASWGTMQRFG